MNLLKMNKGDQIFLTFILILLIGLISLFLFNKKDNSVSSLTSSNDLTNHHIYSTYNFNQNDSIINFGIQPLYLPTNIIFEVIKRDNILNNVLTALGKRIEYYPFLKGADLNFFLQQKFIDGGVGGNMPALSAASTIGVTILAIVQKGFVSIVAHEPMLINDLKGKRIGYPYGSISHYFVLDLLNSVGIEESEVQLIPMDVSSMAAALHNNELDLFSSWEPNVTIDLLQHPDSYIIFRKISNGFLYFSKSFVQMNPEIVNQILASVIRSIFWMKSDKNNLLMACEWTLLEMKKWGQEHDILDAEELAKLVLNDIIGYTSKYEIAIREEQLQLNSPLYKEFEFIESLSGKTKNTDWQQVKNSFNTDLIIKILEDPVVFRLYDYDYKTIK